MSFNTVTGAIRFANDNNISPLSITNEGKKIYVIWEEK